MTNDTHEGLTLNERNVIKDAKAFVSSFAYHKALFAKVCDVRLLARAQFPLERDGVAILMMKPAIDRIARHFIHTTQMETLWVY